MPAIGKYLLIQLFSKNSDAFCEPSIGVSTAKEKPCEYESLCIF